MRITYNGLTATDKYATVHMTIEASTWMKFASCRIPLEALLQEHITEAMDRQVRRRLIQEWSEVDLADPLF